jgi:hypothetical protein
MLKPDDAKFRLYQLLDSLIMSFAIMTNMMSFFVYYYKHIQNRYVAWLNNLANAYSYASATTIILAGRYSNLPRTRPVKDFLSDVIRCLRKLQHVI